PLTEGTYWISVQAHMNYNPNGQWYWQRQAPPLIGSEYHWRNPNGGYGGLTEWGPASVQWPGETDYDLSFALYGTMATDSGKSVIFNNTERKTNSNDTVINAFKKTIVPVSTDIAAADLKISIGNFDNTRDLLGYNVYLEGAFVEYTTNLFFDYDDGTLIDGDPYQAGVSAVYDDGESDPVTYSFVYGTPLVLTLPVEEGFEGGELPDGWMNEYVVASADWQYTYGVNGTYPNAPHSGSFNAYFNDNTGRTTKLVTPQIDLSTASNVTLSFWQARALYAPDVDYLRVYYKNSTAGSWVLLAEYLEPMEDWTEAVLGLPELTDEYYIAFEAEDGWGRGIGLDDISITEEAAYPEISVTPTSINEILDPEGVVVIPVTIENTGGTDLTYDISIVETSDAFDRSKMSANDIIKVSENINLSDMDIAPQGFINNDPPAIDALFDLQFQYYAANLGQGGLETDGNYYYAPEYSGAEINRYDMDGNWLVAFTIPGVAEVRDLAYDGEYFYGSAVNTSLFQMDFTPGAEALISTTTIPVNCRGIAYDDDVDGFWVNNWGDDITLIDRNGAVLNSFSSGTFQSYYGLAYDNFTEGGPYLWGTAQVGPYEGVGFLVQFDIATGLETGVIYDLNNVPSCTSPVGGLFIADGLEFGYVTIGFMVQGQYIVGLELCPSEDAWMTIAPTTGTVPPGTSVVVDVTLIAEDLSDVTKTADIVIANNAGNNVIVDVTMEVLPGEEINPPVNVVVDDELGVVSWLAPTTPIIEDNIDDYAVGDFIGVVGDNWTTWSNAPGGAEDALVTDAQASSAPNSVVVEANNDLVLIMNDYTTGVYSYDMKMYVPDGYCGYFNLQKTSTPGQEWAFQAYYQTNGDVVIDAGAEAALTHPFNHDEWMDLKVIVDLDNDLATYYFNGEEMISYQWTLGTFGDPGLLQFGGVNIFGGANAAQPTDVPMFYFDDIVLSEVSDEITGYNVYLDGVLDTTVGEDVYDFTYEGLIPLDAYTAGVSALYAGDESEIIEVGFIYDPVTTFDPPNNLAAEVVNYNDVTLTWELPGGATSEIAHHTGYDNNGIGTGGAVDFICAARFDAVELAEFYGGWSITGVNIFLHSMDFSYVGIQVYEGGSYGNPGTLVYDQDITASAVAQEWTNHLLTTPVPLAVGNEYWLAYDMQATGDHPAAVDAGPMVPDKGGWMYFNNAWQTLPELGATLDYNWVITGLVSESDAIASLKDKQPDKVAQHIIGRKRLTQYMSDVPLKAEFTRSIRRETTNPVTRNSRSLSSYMIYKDGAELVEITDPAILTYTDTALDAGTYEYTITAIYTNPDGVSEPSGPVNAVVVLDPPINVEAQSQTPNIIVTWDAPARDISAYNVYRDGAVIAEDVTSTMYIDINVQAGEYIYNVTTIFDGGYESAFSEDAPVSHTSGDDILKPIVTELSGNYPNPFNPTTMIKFSLKEAGHVSINIYNMRGQLVKSLVNEELENDYYEIVWDGKDSSGKTTASGVYFYTMRTQNYNSTKKMILMK
ncbi:MAG: hypothetical protein DRI23_07595, partial [Candidatus Cloacimonadota bacterium]